ncbi:MAG: antibiotic ABC transporter ATP-binding protein [Marinilabiliales bacterium]|nr:MAG: antibiotic ABC transporter ATP-binding protein [Marinilabiliales bacterium]
MNKLLSILRYLIPYWFVALFSVICNLFVALFAVVSFAMVIPFLGLLFSTQEFNSNAVPLSLSTEAIQQNFNYYLGQIVQNHGKINALLFIIIIVLVFSILKNIFLFIGKSIIIHIRTNVVKDIRNELMNKILDFDLSYFSDQRRGDIISKMIVDVKEIEMSVISSLELIFKDPILIAVYMYVLFFMSAKLTLIAIIIFPISAIIIGQIGKKLKKTTVRCQQKIGELVGMLEEALSGIKIIKAFNAEKLIEDRFKEQNQYFSDLFSKVWRKRTIVSPLMDVIATIAILSIMWFGGKMVISGEGLSSQLFIGYLAVFTQVISPAKSISGGYYNIIKGMASYDRINTILEHRYKISNKPNAKKIQSFEKRIEFKEVVFNYENEDKSVLNKISFNIEKGQTVAIVGESGSGKSTIVDLLPRFFDPNSGDILIDGTSIKEYDIDSVRDLYAYVNQEPVLFNDTLYNNILFGNPRAERNEIENAAKLSFAHDFIIEKGLAYETNLGEDGSKLSLGEKQRISIARAILKNAPILILDEATSALDYKSESIIRKALEFLMKHKTTIVIAHRLSTIKNADHILVLKEGEIIEQGTHEELLKLNSYYKDLVKFELI